MFRCFRCLLKPSECKDRYFIDTLYTLTQNFFDFFQKSASNVILRGVTKCTFLSGSGGSGYFRPFWASAFPLISPAFPLTLSGAFVHYMRNAPPRDMGKNQHRQQGGPLLLSFVCRYFAPEHHTTGGTRHPLREHPHGNTPTGQGGKHPTQTVNF